jgi:PAS domain S-box-containing protein
MNAQNEHTPLFPSRPSLGRNVLWIASVALLCFLAARLSLLLAFEPEGIAAIWPPEGVFLSAILLTRRTLRFYLVGTLCLTDFTAELLSGTPIFVSAIYALTLTGDAVLSSWLLLRFVGRQIAFTKVREVFGFLTLVVIFSNGLLSLVAAAADLLSGSSSFWNSWKWWAASDGVGNLLVTPFLLSWASWARSRSVTWNPKRALEGAALFLPLALLNFVAFRYLSKSGLFSLLLPYLTFPFLLWAAFRFGIRGVTSALVILAALAVSFAAAGPIRGFPSYGSPLNTVIGVQLYLAILAVPSLFLVAVVTERKKIEEALRASEERFKVIATNTPDQIIVQDADLRYVWVINPQLGLTEGDVIGKTDFDLLGTEEAEKLTKIKREVLTSGKPVHVELPLYRDSNVEYFDGSYVPKYGPEGKSDGLIGYFRNVTERKRVEETLRGKEHLLSESQRVGGIGSWSLDLATYVVTWTDETYRLYGVSPETFVPSVDTLIDLLHPDDRSAMRAWIQTAVEGKDAGVLEFRVVLPDGSIRILRHCDERIPAHGDTPARLTGTIQDITKLKQAQAALLESEERWRILLEQTLDGIFVHEGFQIVQLNDRLAQMAGCTPSELMGSSAIELFTLDSQETIRQYVRSGSPGYFEIELRSRDGRIMKVEAFGAPCKFQGRDARIVGLRDITERKRAEEALRESEERFRAAFEEGAVAMALAALDATLLKVNSSFCRMLGFSESELVGRSFTEITHPDDLPANLIGIQRLACGEVSSFRMEKRYLRKDGAVLWADMSTASVRDAQGQPLYCVTHVHDVTDRKQAEEALRSLNERLELQVAQRTEDLRHTVGRLRQLTLEISQAEDRERRRIADLLHDDVQQTLAAAKFHLNLLSTEARSPEESQEIVEQVKQMLREAIEKSRSLSHELSPVLYQVDLTEVLNWLARHMQRRHGLIVHVEACGPVDSSSEPLKAFFYRVAQELLFNVVKHAGVREARIRVRRMGRCICLSVVDRGCGFDPQRLEGAAGFGLLTIRERVQLLGGRMKIKSVQGAGSRLVIAVPDDGLSQAAAPTEREDRWTQSSSL